MRFVRINLDKILEKFGLFLPIEGQVRDVFEAICRQGLRLLAAEDIFNYPRSQEGQR